MSRRKEGGKEGSIEGMNALWIGPSVGRGRAFVRSAGLPKSFRAAFFGRGQFVSASVDRRDRDRSGGRAGARLVLAPQAALSGLWLFFR